MMESLAHITDDILRNIRGHLQADLETHLSLSQSCRRFRTLYDDPIFWQTACFSSGYGRPLRRGGSGNKPNVPWRTIAHVLSTHSSACQIRSCREASLYFAQESLRRSGSIRASSKSKSARTLTFHPLYFYLHFTDTVIASDTSPSAAANPSPDPLSILLTHLPTFPECKTAQYGPLCVHPNACCAFATFPPVPRLTFQDSHGQPVLSVFNPDGCTLLDVNRALADLLSQTPLHADFALSHYRELVLASGLSLQDFVTALREQKGFLGDHEYPYLQELLTQTN